MQVEKIFTSDDFKVCRTVTSLHHGQRLDVFLMQFMGTLSRSFIQHKIKKGEIWIDTSLTSEKRALPKPHRPSHRVFLGDQVFMYTERKHLEDETFHHKSISLDEKVQILFENEDFAAISKPPFMSSHPTGRHLFNCANLALESIINQKVYSVHRLDRETSGLMLFAKNKKTAGNLITLFSEQKIHKTYFLISKHPSGLSPKEPFWCTKPIHIEKALSGRLFAKLGDHASAKFAATFFHPLQSSTCYSAILAYPQTGRQHQIRAHVADFNLPILGDKMYPDPSFFYRHKDQQTTLDDVQYLELPRQALHAIATTFSLQGKEFKLAAPLPQDLLTWMKDTASFNASMLTEIMTPHLWWNAEFAAKFSKHPAHNQTPPH